MTEFTIGTHTEQAHDYTGALIDEAYRRKANEAHTTPLERVRSADELIEAHYAQLGFMPAESVLSRLAWYVVFDEMTDSHPDKMTREEYPIMSNSQIRRRFNEIPTKNVYFDPKDFAGITRVFKKKDEDANGYVKEYPLYSPQSDVETNAKDTGIDVNDMVNCAGLTDRQREAIELVYLDNLNHTEAGEVMGVTRQAVERYLSFAYDKMRKVVAKKAISYI